MRILVVTCGDPDPAVQREHGAYSAWFRRALGPRVEVSDVDARSDGLSPAAFDEAAAVILSGSPHSVYEPLAWIRRLEAIVRRAVLERSQPVLGVCFGHQLLAQALGGRVERNPRGREIGTIEVASNGAGIVDPLLGALPGRFDVQATHCDTVASLPPGARLLASSRLDGCQVFALASALGVQFHPEISAEIIRSYLELRRPLLESEGLDAAALLAGVRESTAGPSLLAAFARRATARSGLHDAAERGEARERSQFS